MENTELIKRKIFNIVHRLLESIISSEDVRYMKIFQSLELYVIINLLNGEELKLESFVEFDKDDLEKYFEKFKNDFFHYKLSQYNLIENLKEFEINPENISNLEFSSEKLNMIKEIEYLRGKLISEIILEEKEKIKEFHVKKKTRIIIDKLEEKLKYNNNDIGKKLLKVIIYEKKEFNLKQLNLLNNKKSNELLNFINKVAFKYNLSSWDKFINKINKEIITFFNKDLNEMFESIPFDEVDLLEHKIYCTYKFYNNKKLKEGDSSYDFFYDFFDKPNFSFFGLREEIANFSKKSLLENKNIKINSNLVNILKNTDNYIEYRKMFFDDLFIDTTINLDSNFQICGIILTNLDLKTRVKSTTDYIYNKLPFEDILIEGFIDEPELFNKSNVSALFLLKDFNKAETFLSVSFLRDLIDNTSPIFDDIDLEIDIEENFKKKISKEIFNFCCNIFDIINNKQIEYIETKFNEKRNVKLIQRGDKPKPLTTIELKPKEELAKYVKKFNENSRKLNHKLLVRGHYVSFKDKERYANLYSQYENGFLNDNYIYEDSTLKLWKKPYFKGDGIYINKKIKLKNKLDKE